MRSFEILQRISNNENNEKNTLLYYYYWFSRTQTTICFIRTFLIFVLFITLITRYLICRSSGDYMLPGVSYDNSSIKKNVKMNTTITTTKQQGKHQQHEHHHRHNRRSKMIDNSTYCEKILTVYRGSSCIHSVDSFIYFFSSSTFLKAISLPVPHFPLLQPPFQCFSFLLIISGS